MQVQEKIILYYHHTNKKRYFEWYNLDLQKYFMSDKDKLDNFEIIQAVIDLAHQYEIVLYIDDDFKTYDFGLNVGIKYVAKNYLKDIELVFNKVNWRIKDNFYRTYDLILIIISAVKQGYKVRIQDDFRL